MTNDKLDEMDLTGIDLQDALAEADLRVLIMVLYHLTGDAI